MPLDPQEQACVEFALPRLSKLHGGVWRILDGPTPDDMDDSQPTPDCLVTNDLISAAVEVKMLTGGDIERAYGEALRSLRRSLDPHSDGYYVLGPAPAFQPPVKEPLFRHLRREIARVAPKLVRGETGYVRLPRKAWVSLEREQGPGRVHCCHNYTEHLFEELGSRINGSFMLVDDHLPDHSLVTADALENFHAKLSAACYRRTHGESNHFEWYEEIPLLRCDEEEDDFRGLDVLAVTEAFHVDTALGEALDHVLEKALKKFWRSWADLHVIVFDKAMGACNAERLKQALVHHSADELSAADLILMTDKEEVSVLWRLDNPVLRRASGETQPSRTRPT